MAGLSLLPLILGSLGPQAKQFWGPGKDFGVPCIIYGKTHCIYILADQARNPLASAK